MIYYIHCPLVPRMSTCSEIQQARSAHVGESEVTLSRLSSEFTVLKHEYDTAQAELKSLKETHSAQQDQWLKDRLALEQKVS